MTGEQKRIDELEAAMRRLGESWLIKDFNVLYRVAASLADACHGRGDGRPYEPFRALDAQLERLKPAFTDTEEVRRLMRERRGEKP
jgi:hypothetical protein